MGEVRIVERTNVDSSVYYILQKKGLFGWSDITIEHRDVFPVVKRYSSIEDARKDICFPDGVVE